MLLLFLLNYIRQCHCSVFKPYVIALLHRALTVVGTKINSVFSQVYCSVIKNTKEKNAILIFKKN